MRHSTVSIRILKGEGFETAAPDVTPVAPLSLALLSSGRIGTAAPPDVRRRLRPAGQPSHSIRAVPLVRALPIIVASLFSS
jgi:hypothetical protein